jgi:hypothetical protein
MTWPADGRQLPTRPRARTIDRSVHESADHSAGRSVRTGSIRNFSEIARYQIHLFSIHSHYPRAVDEGRCGWTEALCAGPGEHAAQLLQAAALSFLLVPSNWGSGASCASGCSGAFSGRDLDQGLAVCTPASRRGSSQ